MIGDIFGTYSVEILKLDVCLVSKFDLKLTYFSGPNHLIYEVRSPEVLHLVQGAT